MACCRYGRKALVDNAQVNQNTLCVKCSTDMKDMYYMSAEQQTGGKAGEATILVRLDCPQCGVLNAYVVTLERRYDRNPVKK